MAGRKSLALVAGDKVHKREPRRHGWSSAKEARFLEALSATCNVTLAAKRARVGNSTVYRRRATDAVFRAAWGQAVAQGYAAHGSDRRRAVTPIVEMFGLRLRDEGVVVAASRPCPNGTTPPCT